MEEPELWAALVKAAVELTSAQSPKWELIAARLWSILQAGAVRTA